MCLDTIVRWKGGGRKSIESELYNLDLRVVGGKSLPDSSALRKNSLFIHPPKLLQIASVTDISRSSGVDGYKSSSNKRLLKLVLTDGHSEVTAVAYSHIPALSDDVVPGTKGELKIKDFGWAVHTFNCRKTMCGTLDSVEC